MRTRWRTLICFLALPVASIGLLYGADAVGLKLTEKQALTALIAIPTSASWAIGYWHKRNFWEGVLYAMFTAPLTVGLLVAYVWTAIVVHCWNWDGSGECP